MCFLDKFRMELVGKTYLDSAYNVFVVQEFCFNNYSRGCAKYWSSGYGRRLTSWVRIPALYTGWSFFVKIVMCV